MRIRIPMKIKEPAGPAYPPKSASEATSWENCDMKLVLSTAMSAGDILGTECQYSKRRENEYR